MKRISKTKNTHPQRRSVRIRSAFDVSRLLARTVNQLLRDEITEGKAGKVGFLCNVMLKAIELTEIEQRIQKLELAAEEQKREQ